MGPTLHRWCTSRADQGSYNVTGVRLLDTHHCPLRDPVVGSSPYVRCPCVPLLEDTHHLGTQGTQSAVVGSIYVRCPSLLLSAPSSFCVPRDPHVQVGFSRRKFSIEPNQTLSPQLSPYVCTAKSLRGFTSFAILT